MSYILKIDSPCTEQWSGMTANPQGKYCSTCAKNVIDFTNLSDTEIIKLVEQNNSRLCGRFDTSQLNRLIIETKTQSSYPRIYKLLAGLLLLVSSKELAAREHKQENIIQSENNTKSSSLIDENNSNESIAPSDSLKNIVRGRVIDSITKEPLAFANIFIKDSKVGAVTDIEGKFQIVIPDSLLKDKMEFEGMYIGYKPIEFTVLKKDLSIFNKILLVEGKKYYVEESILVNAMQSTTGMVEVTVKEPKKKWWQRRKKVVSE